MCIFTPRLSAPRSSLVAVLFVSDAILPVSRICTIGIHANIGILIIEGI